MIPQERLKAECKITEKEYIRANILFTKLSKKFLIFHVIFDLALLLSTFFLDGYMPKLIAIGAVVGGLAGHLAVRFLYCPWQTKRQYKIHKSIQEPFIISKLLQGIYFKNNSGESTLKWDDIIKWRENKELLLVYQTDFLYYIIPKRIGDLAESIKNSLQHNIGNPK
ncbi:MAG: hypothetical protein CSB24_02085 [Deltaproteobacteria bacterium]|nr:MAG: hypothetical protein CSB24_02085 [Deltaproteobacteria bacterium]